jgi:hypothetical protein
MDGAATITLTADVVLHPSPGGLQKWLPGIHKSVCRTRQFDARAVISQMANFLTRQLYYAIKTDTIVATLEEFIRYFAPKTFFDPPVGVRLHKNMEDCLRKDLDAATTSDLRRIRHRFLIFCLASQLTRSVALAECMVVFFRDHLHRIVFREEPGMFREWCMGICVLQGLISDRVLEQLLHCFSGSGGRAFNPRRQPANYDLWAEIMMKGRHYPFFNHQQRKIPQMLEGEGDRFLSVGRPRRHRRRGPLQIAYPWMHSNGYPDKLGKLKHQQEAMNMKLDHIDRKLDHLF